MIGITAFGLLALSLPVFASTDTPDASSQAGWVGVLLTLLIWYVCASRRKKEIGGWLLYYYIRLYIGVIIVVLVAVSSYDSYLPEAWADKPDRFRYDPTHFTSGLNT